MKMPTYNIDLRHKYFIYLLQKYLVKAGKVYKWPCMVEVVLITNKSNWV